MSDKNDNPDSSISLTVQRTLGTAAGMSSLLAVLYKFTPGRKWLHSRIGGSMGKIHANFYTDGPKELLFDGMEHNDFNSYSIGYEAM
ncbi:hypothetical protein PVT01_000064800 [Plasmodium vivax]|uniref:Vir protein n=1 Tax=Plasmodium vivax TaxID=5855 RepID=A0A1G4EAI0_PLAVI|nr:hypothetical protein PVT01_000064800 [Plasmodium vivax]